MKKIIFCMLFLATVRLSAQGTLSGVVINPYGEAEFRVPVELFINDGKLFDEKIDLLVAQTQTDTAGNYLIEGIAPGTYAVRFNNKEGDSTCITIIMVNVEIADGDKLLDVRLHPRCTSFGAEYACIQNKGNITSKISVPVKTHSKSKELMKVEFEVIANGEKSILYAHDGDIVTQNFSAGTGRVGIGVYEHVGKNKWQLIETYVRKPHISK